MAVSKKESEILSFIQSTYGELIEDAAEQYELRPKILAGIMMRETHGGLSPLLDKQGPEGRGDKGHGHGLMQIDDRWHKEFIESGQWRDPRKNIGYAASLLATKRRYLRSRMHIAERVCTQEELERWSIVAYNAGEYRVWITVMEGRDPDACTTGKNYSKEVLRFADAYLKGNDVDVDV